MGGISVLVPLLWLILWLITRGITSAAAKHPRAPRQPVSAMKRPSTTRTMTALIRTRWGDPQVGGPSFESLVRARRFDEAARVMDLDDWTQRTLLAVARGGPTPDLIRAKNYPPSRRLSWLALRTLERIHGEALIPPTFIGAYVGDDAAVLDDKVARLLQRGRFARSARLLERKARRWPRADDITETRERIAYAWALSGDFERARACAAEVSVEANDAATSARMTRVAEGLHRRSATATASGTRNTGVARTKSFRIARNLRFKAFHKFPSPNTLYPGALASALEGLRHRTGFIPFDPRAVADALNSGHVAHVGILIGTNLHGLSVQAIECDSGVALLSSGELVEWEDLRSLSLWGDRVLVSKRNRVSVSTIEHSPVVVSPALDASGTEASTAATCATARAEVDAHPNDPLAAFVYWRLLLRAGPDLVGHPTASDFAAACTARHLGVRWPEMALAESTDPTEEDATRDLYVCGSPPHFGVEASIALAHARLSGLGDWALISRAQVADPSGLPPMELGIRWAVLTSRGPDVDAHLEAIEKLHPHADSLPYWRVMREIAWRGGRDAYPILASGFLKEQPLHALGLALHSGSPTYLAEATKRLKASQPAQQTLRVAEAVMAMHRGDAVAAVDVATRAASGFGWSPSVSDVVIDAVSHQASVSEFDAIARILAQAPSDGTPALGMIASAALHTHAYELALTLSRLDMASGAWDGAVRHAGVVLLLSRVGAADLLEARVALKSVAQSADPALHRAVACAVALETDADEAWDMVSELSAQRQSFATHLLVAAIASARSDSRLADAHLTRAANPRLAEDGWRMARLLGITPWAERAVSQIDARLAPSAMVGLYGHGASIASFPAVPAPGREAWPIATIDRLALEGDPALTVAAAKHRWSAPLHPNSIDGTRGATAHALALTLAGQTDQLEGLVSESRHPAVGFAAYAAARAGADVPWSRESIAATLPTLQRIERIGVQS